MSFLQEILIGAPQGITEPFRVPSLGHSVLVPAWLGWDTLVAGLTPFATYCLAARLAAIITFS